MSSEPSTHPTGGDDLAGALSSLSIQHTRRSDLDPTLPQNRPSTSSHPMTSSVESTVHDAAKATVEQEDRDHLSDEAPDDFPFTSTLNACSTCGGHHYTTAQCVYSLDYTSYLTYHALYLSSLPHNLDVSVASDEYDEGDGPCATGELSDLALWQRAKDLDIDTKGMTELKEELLTQSSKAAMQDSEIWQERLTEGSEYWHQERDLLEVWRETGGEVKRTVPNG